MKPIRDFFIKYMALIVLIIAILLLFISYSFKYIDEFNKHLNIKNNYQSFRYRRHGRLHTDKGKLLILILVYYDIL